ncbi:hypothetical protein DUI87_04740 [Hirundo rustica rustica]|uniref:Uncharacterized protein n=1 Tax=Hirundo rustica rustica TaxID=333673 RepID=A0A3M0L4M8_HIRRU|nr:hypothetical protein DUI87_04740 [Hirundo rustica rustica]
MYNILFYHQQLTTMRDLCLLSIIFDVFFKEEKQIDFHKEEQQEQGDRAADTASNAAGPDSQQMRMDLGIMNGFWWRDNESLEGEDLKENLHPVKP